MRTINAQPNQTLYDIALQECGDQSAAIEIALLNNMDLTDVPETGTTLVLPEVVDRRVRKYYIDNKIKPATNLPE